MTPSVVRVDVPVRVCDVGGWTDTWFAGHGRVCSLAVEPGVTVEAQIAGRSAGRVSITVVDYDLTFTVGDEPPEHRLLAEAVREAGALDGVDVALTVRSAVPPGSSLGTSGAVAVGVVAAIDALRGPLRGPASLAAAAHRAEAGRLGRQSGVQDQVAAAHGGANLLRIGPYPDVAVRPLALPPAVTAALQDRLVHVAYGDPHDSSAVHEEVIAALTDEGPAAPRLERLRQLADEAAAALASADLDAYGRTLTAATEAQAALHPALVSHDASAIIDLARRCGAAGWKVNGAGGQGGSLSILSAPGRPAELLQHLRAAGHAPLDLHLAAAGARSSPP
jgi:D-glycero-alpha-D-manno-heptose-7-phosphate kinase